MNEWGLPVTQSAWEWVSNVQAIRGAPSVAALHAEYIERGGRFFACPVCVKSRDLENAEWVQGAEVKGVPSLLEFTQGGALTFNY